MNICFKLKIYSIFFISLAFTFKLLSVNTHLPSLCNNQYPNKLLSLHCSAIHNERHETRATIQPGMIDYEAMEVCEEGPDNEDDLTKDGSPVLLSFLHASLKKSTNSSGSNNPFDAIKCSLYQKKHLALSVLRI